MERIAEKKKNVKQLCETMQSKEWIRAELEEVERKQIQKFSPDDPSFQKYH